MGTRRPPTTQAPPTFREKTDAELRARLGDLEPDDLDRLRVLAAERRNALLEPIRRSLAKGLYRQSEKGGRPVKIRPTAFGLPERTETIPPGALRRMMDAGDQKWVGMVLLRIRDALAQAVPTRAGRDVACGPLDADKLALAVTESLSDVKGWLADRGGSALVLPAQTIKNIEAATRRAVGRWNERVDRAERDGSQPPRIAPIKELIHGICVAYKLRLTPQQIARIMKSAEVQ